MRGRRIDADIRKCVFALIRFLIYNIAVLMALFILLCRFFKKTSQSIVKVKFFAYNIYSQSESGGIGRREGLKIPWPQGRGGSIPPSRTTQRFPSKNIPPIFPKSNIVVQTGFLGVKSRFYAVLKAVKGLTVL